MSKPTKHKPKANKPNVFLSDRTKSHVKSKTHWQYATFDKAVMRLCEGNFNLARENHQLKAKNQNLTEAIQCIINAMKCCQGCQHGLCGII